MTIATAYVCDFCGTEYGNEAEARACESQGFPEPMPWIEKGYFDLIPAFGERGVEMARITDCWIERSLVGLGPHEWYVATTPYIHLNHNRGFDPVPASAFDPRVGWDAFRYSNKGADVWLARLQECGFTKADLSFGFRVPLDFQADFQAALEKLK